MLHNTGPKLEGGGGGRLFTYSALLTNWFILKILKQLVDLEILYITLVPSVKQNKYLFITSQGTTWTVRKNYFHFVPEKIFIMRLIIELKLYLRSQARNQPATLWILQRTKNYAHVFDEWLLGSLFNQNLPYGSTGVQPAR